MRNTILAVLVLALLCAGALIVHPATLVPNAAPDTGVATIQTGNTVIMVKYPQPFFLFRSTCTFSPANAAAASAPQPYVTQNTWSMTLTLPTPAAQPLSYNFLCYGN